MKLAFSVTVSVLLLIFGLIPNIPAKKHGKGTNGGFKCLGCTYIFAMLDQLSFIHNESMSDSALRFCSFLPDANLMETCTDVSRPFGSWLNNIHSTGATPDEICQAIGMCTNIQGKYCNLFPKKKAPDSLHKLIEMRQYFPEVVELANALVTLEKMQSNINDIDAICKLPFISKICFAFKTYFNHKPIYDNDGDFFSQRDTFRGAYWRGKDCDDSNAKIHPGVKAINSDIHTDSNCNGIYGTDPQGRPYEDLFCKNTSQRGFAVVGDSVAAHLHLPEEWFDASKISKDALKDVLLVVEDQFDWPQLSSATGFMETIWDIIKGPTDSLYHRLWKRNHCIHRDFQNIGINGASSFTQLQYVKSLSRNQTLDHPLIVAYELIGNDVCNWHPDTLKNMTTPKEMFHNTMEILKYLDTILPTGSFVIILGLVDGRLLYDSMHNRIHPIGRTRNDVTYKDYYDYFGCMQLTMCAGWMTSNETLRDLTQERAEQLNLVLQEITEKHNNFKNFRLHFIGQLFHNLIEYWEKKHGSAWQLIEPVDAFHNNQFGQAISTKIIWDTIESEFPEILEEVNPHNEKIERIFGNQGGY